VSRSAPLLAAVAATLVACERGADEHAGHDHGPPGESSDTVALTPEQLESAGIAVASAGPGRVERRLPLTAVVRPDLDAQAHITPKVPGLVRTIHKHLGEQVAAGDLVAEVESVELGQAVSRYLEAVAIADAAGETLAQERELLDRKVEVAETIYAREAELKEQEITTLRPSYEAERALSAARLERRSRLLALQASLRQREIALETAGEQLHILGLNEAGVAALRDEARDGHRHGRYPIHAPRAGVIVERDVTENEFVDTDDKLFLVQDLREVWVVAAAYEADLRHLRRGQPAVVRLDAFPEVALRGEVTFIQYEVGRTSRAAEVRVELPNSGVPGWEEPFPLRPGMFGKVEVVLEEREAAVVIPEAAVVHEGERDFVFVRLGDHDDHDDHDDAGPPARFARRAVELGVLSGDDVEVLSGLEPGDAVVTAGAFTLESLARQGELGGGHSH